MLMTMSISRAPSSRARRVSNSFVSVIESPCGKPTTVPTTTFEPARSPVAEATSAGLTQTDHVPYRSASSQPARTSSSVSSGRRSEWSIIPATSLTVSSAGITRVAVLIWGEPLLDGWRAAGWSGQPLEQDATPGTSGQRSRASRPEFGLGTEALDRLVAHEPLYRVHECVFGVLALESEPVDPRLQFDPSAGPQKQKRPRQDSNLRTRLRRPMLYPLSYEGLLGCGLHASGTSAILGLQ